MPVAAWESLLAPQTLPYFLAASLTLGLGLGLLWLNPASPVHRAFSLVLLLRSGSSFLNVVRGLPGITAAEADFLLRVIPYFLLPVLPLLAYFASVYPRRRGWLGRHRWAFPLVLGLAGVLKLLYLTDHDLLWTLAPATPALGPFSAAGNGFAYVAYGPLLLVVASLPLAYGFLGLVFATEYARDRSAPTRTSWRLVAYGFLLNAVFDGSLGLVNASSLLGNAEPYPWMPWGWALALLPPLALVPSVLGLRALARDAAATEDPAQRRRLWRLLGLAPLPALSALLIASPLLDAPFARFTLGLWRLALPVLATYALLRYQLFDLDVKVKFVVRQSTLAAIVLTVFFVVSEAAQEYFATSFGGEYVGILATAVLVFAFHPLQRFAERLADTAVPGAKAIAEMDKAERAKLYRTQAALAWENGTISRKERLMLNNLRDQLGLGHAEAERMELEAAPS